MRARALGFFRTASHSLPVLLPHRLTLTPSAGQLGQTRAPSWRRRRWSPDHSEGQTCRGPGGTQPSIRGGLSGGNPAGPCHLLSGLVSGDYGFEVDFFIIRKLFRNIGKYFWSTCVSKGFSYNKRNGKSDIRTWSS